MKKGKFIVIEGMDGAGKGTQLEILKEKLRKNRKIENYIFLREPGGTSQGDDIRKVIMDYKLNSTTQALLFYASRNELILEKIIPALEAGKNIICDRYELSTFAYQIYANQDEDSRELIEFLQKKISIIPDKYYFFDISAETSKKRTSGRGEENTHFDDENVSYFERLRLGYKTEIKKYEHKIIDASKEVDEVSSYFIDDVIKFCD
ncbi:MAG TPA: dTMP kinase [Candidatus Pacebacteria bacterium]|nr:dTMP kinase [Candidatus Paceibacterota bacterium]